MKTSSSFIESAPVTLALITANTLTYLVLGFLGGSFISVNYRLLALLGQFNLLIVKYGWWWQLITSLFVHLNLVHLLLNMFWLAIIGVSFEKSLGSKFLLLSYFLSGLAGNILSLAVDLVVFNLSLYTISAGASGAILGLAATLAVVSSLTLGNPGKAIAYLVFLFLLNSFTGNVDILGHLGGILGGALIGYTYVKLKAPKREEREFTIEITYKPLEYQTESILNTRTLTANKGL